jgi:hypothetical protein
MCPPIAMILASTARPLVRAAATMQSRNKASVAVKDRPPHQRYAREPLGHQVDDDSGRLLLKFEIAGDRRVARPHLPATL